MNSSAFQLAYFNTFRFILIGVDLKITKNKTPPMMPSAMYRRKETVYIYSITQVVAINKANIDDAQEITDIKIKAFNKEINTYLGRNGGSPGYDKIEYEIYIIQNFIVYKIVVDNQIIGALFLNPVGNSTMRFEDFVIPSFQGKGYGFRVMELIEKTYPDINEWHLSTPVFSSVINICMRNLVI